MEDADKSQTAVALKDAIIVVPLTGSILAMCWEEGSFLPIGASAFSYFSFTEHVTFAIPALPIALLFAVAAYPAAIATKPLGDLLGKGGVDAFSKRIVQISLLFAAVILGLAYLQRSAMLAAMALSAMLAALTQFDSSLVRRRTVILIGMTISLLTLAVGSGVDFMRSRLNEGGEVKVETLTNGTVTAVAVRGGERGLLLYDRPKQEFIFLKWDSIRSTTWRRAGPLMLR